MEQWLAQPVLANVLEQTQWDFFWVPDDVTVVDRPELAFLSSPRPVDHVNSVYRLRASGDALVAAVCEVAKAHRGPSRIQLADTIELASIERELTNAGYVCGHGHVAAVVDVNALRPRPSGGFRVVQVADLETMRDSILVIDEAFAQPSNLSDARLEAMLALSTAANARVIRFVAYDSADEPVAYGGLNVFKNLRFGLFWGGSTRAFARGKGAYSAVVAARVACAQTFGLKHVGLYARESTSAPIVARQGFKDVGRMHHWNR